MSGAKIAAAFQKLLPQKLPPGLSTRPANLYQVLSRYAVDGVGQRVHQTRWTSKGISDCYWMVTRTSMPIWNRQQDKPPRGTYTGWSEVQLEKWGFGCPNDTDVERTRYTMITQGLHWPITLHSRRYDILHNYILYV
jgi:hypothetical protein